MKTADQIIREEFASQGISWDAYEVTRPLVAMAVKNSVNNFASQFHSTDRVVEEIGKGWDMCNNNRFSPGGYPDKETYLKERKKELEK